MRVSSAAKPYSDDRQIGDRSAVHSFVAGAWGESRPPHLFEKYFCRVNPRHLGTRLDIREHSGADGSTRRSLHECARI